MTAFSFDLDKSFVEQAALQMALGTDEAIKRAFLVKFGREVSMDDAGRVKVVGKEGQRIYSFDGEDFIVVYDLSPVDIGAGLDIEKITWSRRYIHL